VTQLHRRFTDDQVRVLLNGYCQGLLGRAEVQEMLGIGKTRFFALVKEYRNGPGAFSVAYERHTPGRLPAAVEMAIERELLREKAIVDDKRLPISGYNYSALRDRLSKKGIKVSVNTIIDRAKRLDCYKARKKRKTHDREVLTASIGALIQHDSSLHLWSPFAEEKWALITSIDDFSRKLLFADFVPKDTTWAHIQAAQTLMQSYGIPLRYYVDSLRVFRFVQGRDSVWRKHVLQTDDVDTQWGKMMRVLGVDVTYALSPQAKGRITTPFHGSGDVSRPLGGGEKATQGQGRNIMAFQMVAQEQARQHEIDHIVPETFGAAGSTHDRRARQISQGQQVARLHRGAGKDPSGSSTPQGT